MIRALLLFSSLFIALLISELYFRVIGEHRYPTPNEAAELTLDYKPSVFSRHVLARKKGNFVSFDSGTEYSINSHGYRGPEFAANKPKETIRIMIYGGSAAFDPLRNKGKDWPRLVETRLHSLGVTNAEVINAGIPGHASFDSLGRFLTEGHLFHPDYVLIYNTWNDIKHFTMTDPLLRQLEPFSRTSDLRKRPINWLDGILAESSELYLQVRSFYLVWKYKPGLEGSKLKSLATTSEIAPHALKQFELGISSFVDLVRNAKAVPVLMTQATLVAAQNTDEEKDMVSLRMSGLSYKDLISAFRRAETVFRKISLAKKVPLIDASLKMTGDKKYFVDHVHLTEEGSEKLGELTGEGLFAILKKEGSFL